jgi:hypothetical protein
VHGHVHPAAVRRVDGGAESAAVAEAPVSVAVAADATLPPAAPATSAVASADDARPDDGTAAEISGSRKRQKKSGQPGRCRARECGGVGGSA